MRLIGILLALSAAAAVSDAALANSGGTWRIRGTISGRSFELDCRLDPGGVCVDASKRSRSHPLTSLAMAGAVAHWGFTTKVLVAKVALRFHGRIEGNRMSGEVTGAGRKGTFTGVRG